MSSRKSALRECVKMMARRGQPVTMRDVASSTGMSHSNLTRLFGSKTSLQTSAAEMAFSLVVPEIERVLDGVDSDILSNIDNVSCVIRAMSEGLFSADIGVDRDRRLKVAILIVALSALRELRYTVLPALGAGKGESERGFYMAFERVVRMEKISR